MSETSRAHYSEPCETIGPQLSAFVDGELSATEREFVSGHLAQCHTCAITVARERQLQTMLRAAAGVLTLGTPAAQRIRGDVLAQGSTGHSHRRLRRWLLPLAGAAAALLIAVILFPRVHRAQATPLINNAVQVHRQRTLGAHPAALFAGTDDAVHHWTAVHAGHDVDVPTFTGLGYQLSGVRSEADFAPQAVSFVYNSEAGPITCIVLNRRPALDRELAQAVSPATATSPPPGTELPAISAFARGNVTVVGWSAGSGTYLIIGTQDRTTLLRLAALAAPQYAPY